MESKFSSSGNQHSLAACYLLHKAHAVQIESLFRSFGWLQMFNRLLASLFGDTNGIFWLSDVYLRGQWEIGIECKSGFTPYGKMVENHLLLRQVNLRRIITSNIFVYPTRAVVYFNLMFHSKPSRLKLASCCFSAHSQTVHLFKSRADCFIQFI